MRQQISQLKNIIASAHTRAEVVLSQRDERLYRMLKTHGERAAKGREVASVAFESKVANGEVSLVMLLEGRHALSVGNQVVRGFDGNDELKFASVKRTESGAIVTLRTKGA